MWGLLLAEEESPLFSNELPPEGERGLVSDLWSGPLGEEFLSEDIAVWRHKKREGEKGREREERERELGCLLHTQRTVYLAIIKLEYGYL